jgi:hypothetical protein
LNELMADLEREGKEPSWENIEEFKKKHGIVIH